MTTTALIITTVIVLAAVIVVSGGIILQRREWFHCPECNWFHSTIGDLTPKPPPQSDVRGVLDEWMCDDCAAKIARKARRAYQRHKRSSRDRRSESFTSKSSSHVGGRDAFGEN